MAVLILVCILCESLRNGIFLMESETAQQNGGADFPNSFSWRQKSTNNMTTTAPSADDHS